MSALSNKAKGVSTTLYSDGRLYTKVSNKFNALLNLLRVTPQYIPEGSLIVASEFSIDRESQRYKIDDELLYAWFISAASLGNAFACSLLWTQLCSNEKYCKPTYSKEFSEETLVNLLKRVTLTRVTVSVGNYVMSRPITMLPYAVYVDVLRAAYTVMKTALANKDDSIDDRSKGKLTRFSNVCYSLANCALYPSMIMASDERDEDLAKRFVRLAEEALVVKYREENLPPIEPPSLI